MPFGDLVAEAAGVPPGSDGLLFLPYLTGERSPHPDPLARGAFVGLTVGHERRHLTRAVLEGVAFGLRDGLDLMIAAGMPAPTQIRVSGGGTASPLWRQILADVLDAEIATVDTTEGAAYGAGVLAAVGAGWFADGRGRDGRVGRGDDRRPTPGPGRRAVRASGTRPTASSIPALAPTFHRRPERRPRSPRLSRGARAPPAPCSVTSPGFLPRMIIPRISSVVTLVLVDRVDDPAVVHDADPVGQVVDVVDVVADQEDPDPLVLELADEVPDLGGLGRAERRGRLVHDQDLGVEVDRPGDRHRLALAAGQRLDRHR